LFFITNPLYRKVELFMALRSGLPPQRRQRLKDAFTTDMREKCAEALRPSKFFFYRYKSNST
jgi:hypothetical protein